MHPENPERFVHELDRLLAGHHPESDGLSDDDARLLEWSVELVKVQPAAARKAQAGLRQRLEDRLASRTRPARLLWASLVFLVAVTGLLVVASLAMYSVHGEPAIAADNAAPVFSSRTAATTLAGGATNPPVITPRQVAHPLPTPLAPGGANFYRLASPAHTPLAGTQLAAP